MTGQGDGSEKARDIYIARQPVFDGKGGIFGYELLFRTSLENRFDARFSVDYAAAHTLLDVLTVFHLGELCRGRRAFINVTETVLMEGLIRRIPPDQVVVELLENVPPTREVVREVAKLRNLGYVIALDDFEYDPDYQGLIELAQIIKIDFTLTRGADREAIMGVIGRSGKQFLAEKVETREDYETSRSMGYQLFQGYFFRKPMIVVGRDLPPNKLVLLQLLQEVNQKNTDIKVIEQLLRQDVALSFKLLRLINSAVFGLFKEVRSIRHAVNLLGIREFQKWLSMMALARMSQDKPEELMLQSLVRAVFCEGLSNGFVHHFQKSDFFLTGLFSLIDAFLDRPMEGILEQLPLEAQIKQALLGEPNTLGLVLDLCRCYEETRWDEVLGLSERLGIPRDEVGKAYLNALSTTNTFLAIHEEKSS